MTLVEELVAKHGTKNTLVGEVFNNALRSALEEMLERCAVIADAWDKPAEHCGAVFHSDELGPIYRCSFIKGHCGEHETLDQRNGGPEALPTPGNWNEQIAFAIRALGGKRDDRLP